MKLTVELSGGGTPSRLNEWLSHFLFYFELNIE